MEEKHQFLGRGRIALALLMSAVLHGLIAWLIRPFALPDFQNPNHEAPPVFEVSLVNAELDRHPAAVGAHSSDQDSSLAAGDQAQPLSPSIPIAPAGFSRPLEPRAEDSKSSRKAQLQSPPGRNEVVVSVGPADFTVPAPPPAGLKSLAVQEPISVTEATSIEHFLEDVTDKLPQLLSSGEALRWRDNGRVFTAMAELQAAADQMALDRAMVTIAVENTDERRETRLHFKRLAFSNFAQLVNRWDPNVAISQDRIDGRFHANSSVNVDAARGAHPTFTGKVTTAAGVNLGRGLRKPEVFLGGLETRAQRIPLPRELSPIGGDKQLPPDQLLQFSSDTTITFHGDGGLTWRSEDSPSFQYASVSERGLYLIGNQRSQLSVEGTVRGKVVVYTGGRIVIAGDLRYARDPVTIADSPDFLGLISESYVEVGHPHLVGPGDLTVQAAIYAGRRFSVRSFRTRNSGTLHIYGSLTAGSISATEPRYATQLVFDRRLDAQRPPGFPVTDRFELESWERHWTVTASANR